MKQHLVNSDNSLPLLETGNKQHPLSKKLCPKSEYNLKVTEQYNINNSLQIKP